MSNRNKKDGVYYEQVFIAEALKRDLEVSETVGDALPYDVVVMCGSHSYRVQVKGTSGVSDRYHRRYMFGMKSGVHKKINTEFDVFAGYVRQEHDSCWYLIPQHLCNVTSIKVYPDIQDSKGKYEKYMNNWTVFNPKSK